MWKKNAYLWELHKDGNIACKKSDLIDQYAPTQNFFSHSYTVLYASTKCNFCRYVVAEHSGLLGLTGVAQHIKENNVKNVHICEHYIETELEGLRLFIE